VAVLLLVGLAAALEPDSSLLLLFRICVLDAEHSSLAALLFVLATTAASIAAKVEEAN